MHHAPTPAESMKPFEMRYHQHIYSLADPQMEGRAPGTDGNRRAATYIEFYWRQMGLEPAFVVPEAADDEDSSDDAQAIKAMQGTPGERTYRQVFTAPASRRPGDSVRIEKQEVGYDAPGGHATLEPGTDFNVLGYSGSGTLTGKIAFVGYSIEEGGEDYTSYPLVDKKEVDLTGKIAMVLRFEPMDVHGKSKWSDARWSPAAGLDGKLKAAASRNAAGIILVNPPGADDPRAAKLDDLSLAGRTPLKVPVVMLSQDAADALVKAADPQGRSLMDLREAADESGGIIDLDKTSVALDVTIKKIPLLTDNIGAMLPGVGDLKDEIVVVGSHYDHVGYGYFGSRDPEPRGKLHPGADDNASGSCGNLLVSMRMKDTWDELGDTPRRTILFLAFSAEESGLIGSKFYTKHPIAPLDKHALMLNMDMIGRYRGDDEKGPGLELGGVGTAVGLKDWLTPYIDESGLKIAPKPSGLGPSDHASFAGAGVPALFFFTGLHKEYHTPQDTPDLINVEGAARVADLVYRVALDAALRPEPFVFTSATGRDNKDAKDEEKKDDNNTGSVAGVGVRFGVAPGDYSGEDGVVIGEVFPDLPASKAGLKEGDRMISWNGHKLDTVESWMPMLEKHKPGDKVTIVYVRKVDGADHEFTTEATLVARRSGPQ